MDIQETWMTMSDQEQIFLKQWSSHQTKPKAIILLIHGMTEHIERYYHFAEHLISHGFVVYGYDQRGHGKTANDQQLTFGYLANTKGFERLTNDAIEVTDNLREKHPSLPVFVIAHSMGSFVARHYMTHPEAAMLSGVILLGTGMQPKPLLIIGKWLAKMLGKWKGKATPSPFMNQLTFLGYNKKVENNTSFDWLTRDQETIQAYIEDPLCGFIPTHQFFYDLYKGLQLIQQKDRAKHIPKDLPIYFLSGDADPVGQLGKGIKKTYHFYQSVGLSNLDLTIYPEARHELFNESNRFEVYQHVLSWLDKQMICAQKTHSV
ncbi:lipase [Gracilibacillus halophilus YIM-C55.5]|uniref:Lipase n=1 Tax=Gracilibacillus halophilus YIM-C55.5 TaxID=1308866 RepID=N4WR40_9BACI|nr:alpha/beta hydrolase [Gracilibacillus halophilus]ENH96905.1 lipase [Gracilibacillus halophilus YIM-C55.5]